MRARHVGRFGNVGCIITPLYAPNMFCPAVVLQLYTWACAKPEVTRVHVAFHYNLFLLVKSCADKSNYYTSDSLWKIWLVESIQSIHNSLWTWHDKCNICCRYCVYHVKFNVCLVTNPLGVFRLRNHGWTLRFCFWGWIMWKMYNKTIIEFGFRMISWIIKTSCLCYLPQLSASADNTDLGFDNPLYHAQPHPTIVYYLLCFQFDITVSCRLKMFKKRKRRKRTVWVKDWLLQRERSIKEHLTKFSRNFACTIPLHSKTTWEWTLKHLR